MVNPLDCQDVSASCPVEASIYGYFPSVVANGGFAVFFAVSLAVNVVLGWRYRTWSYMIGLSLGCLFSAVGYATRVLLHKNPFNDLAFKVQIVGLIIAPAFFSASLYLILKHVCLCFGKAYSRVRPALYTWIFITADTLSLVLQGVGGGIAATAGDDGELRDKGDAITMAGISWQVFTLVVFAGLALDYIVRRAWGLRRIPHRVEPLSEEAKATASKRRFRLFGVGLGVAYLCILLRCVYRIAEMAGGWRNPIMQNQVFFIAFEGCMIITAVLLMTLLHPGYCFPRMSGKRGALSKGGYMPMPQPYAAETLALSERVSPYKAEPAGRIGKYEPYRAGRPQ